MFNTTSSNGHVQSQAFGERGQAFLRAAGDRALHCGSGNATLEQGAAAADHYSDSFGHDRHDASPFNSAEANDIQRMNALRTRSVGGFVH